MFVRTLLGDVSPDTLGTVYSHDHIYCIPPHWVEQGEDDLLLDSFESSKQEVLLFKEAGGNAIYDATAWDYGRNAGVVARISEETGIKIIATAGFNKGLLWGAHIPGQDGTFFEWLEQNSVDAIAQKIIDEVELGLDGTTYKGGVVKCGTGYNRIHPVERKVMTAAVVAQKTTGAPFHSHTELGTMILEQIAIFKEEGLDLERLFIPHADRNPDPWVHLKALEQGVTLCFDGPSRIKYHPENVRIENILTLVKRGFSDKIVIGGDIARKSMFASYGLGGLGMGYILNSWVPRFIEEAGAAGLDGSALIKKFFVDNPSRVLSFP